MQQNVQQIVKNIKSTLKLFGQTTLIEEKKKLIEKGYQQCNQLQSCIQTIPSQINKNRLRDQMRKVRSIIEKQEKAVKQQIIKQVLERKQTDEKRLSEKESRKYVLQKLVQVQIRQSNSQIKQNQKQLIIQQFANNQRITSAIKIIILQEDDSKIQDLNNKIKDFYMIASQQQDAYSVQQKTQAQNTINQIRQGLEGGILQSIRNKLYNIFSKMSNYVFSTFKRQKKEQI